MITPGEYQNNNGRRVTIAGRIKKYSAECPWVYSIQGDWYDEMTGQFVGYGPVKGKPGEFQHSLYPVGAGISLKAQVETVTT
jgi:hypothetical protein